MRPIRPSFRAMRSLQRPNLQLVKTLSRPKRSVARWSLGALVCDYLLVPTKAREGIDWQHEPAGASNDGQCLSAARSGRSDQLANSAGRQQQSDKRQHSQHMLFDEHWTLSTHTVAGAASCSLASKARARRLRDHGVSAQKHVLPQSRFQERSRGNEADPVGRAHVIAG